MWPLMVSTLIASWVGSVHCAGMCGPLVALASHGNPRTRNAALYNLGRGFSYIVLGMCAGWIGHHLDRQGTLWIGINRTAAMLAACTMVIWGVWMIATQHTVRRQSAMAQHLQRVLRPVMRAAYQCPPHVRPLAIGMLTPLLPCGWLYLNVATAAGAGSIWLGALVMIIFWLGNMPTLMAVNAVLVHLRRWFGRYAQTWAGAVLIIGAIMTLTMRMPTRHATPATQAHPTCHQVP